MDSRTNHPRVSSLGRLVTPLRGDRAWIAEFWSPTKKPIEVTVIGIDKCHADIHPGESLVCEVVDDNGKLYRVAKVALLNHWKNDLRRS